MHFLGMVPMIQYITQTASNSSAQLVTKGAYTCMYELIGCMFYRYVAMVYTFPHYFLVFRRVHELPPCISVLVFVPSQCLFRCSKGIFVVPTRANINTHSN